MINVKCHNCSLETDSKSMSNGLCKKCYHRAWYLKNREKKLAQNQLWEEANRDKRAVIKKRTRTKYLIEGRRKALEYYYKNKNVCLERSKKYRTTHKEEKKAYKRKYGQRTGYQYEKSRRYAGYKKLSRLFRQELIAFYTKKPEGLVVDHIIPLKGKHVSGLHVPWNLQYLTVSENCKKLNSFDGSYDNSSWRSACKK